MSLSRPDSDPKLRGRLAGVLGWLAVLLAGGVAGWFAHRLGGAASSGEADTAALVGPGDLAARVTTAAAVRGPIDVTLAAFGAVRATPTAAWTLTSRASSPVEEVAVTAGQHVREGELLLRLGRQPLDAMVATARAELASAEADLAVFTARGRSSRGAQLRDAATSAVAAAELAASRVEHLQALRADQLVAERTLREARSASARLQRQRDLAQQDLRTWLGSGAEQERQRLEAAVAGARSRLVEREQVLASLEVRAPADGTVVDVVVKAGELPAAGAPLGHLVSGPGRLLELAAAPEDRARIQLDMPVRVRDGDGEYRGRVTAVVPAVDPDTGLLRVTASLEEGDAPPLPVGAAVRVEVVVRHLEAATLVPAAAVVTAGDQLVVVVADAEHLAHRVPVRVVARRRGLCAVDGKVAAGDTVVVAGAYNLPDGARVVPSEASGTGEEHR